VRVRVDKARRDNHSGGVDTPIRLGRSQIADRRDAVALYSDIRYARRRACAVYDRAAL
jgi:hypothetical protein